MGRIFMGERDGHGKKYIDLSGISNNEIKKRWLIFKGEFKDGLKNGKGVEYYPPQEKMLLPSFWKKMKKKLEFGDQEMLLSEIPFFEGNFKNDVRDGVGLEYSKQGFKTFQGVWREGKVVKIEKDFVNLKVYDVRKFEFDMFRDKIGSGSEGDVFRVDFEGIPSALKILKKPQQEDSIKKINQRKSLIRSLGIWSKVHDHPNIVSLYCWSGINYQDLNSPLGYCMNLCGSSLADMLIKGYQFDWKTKIRMLYEIAGSIFFLHEKSIMHRDLKLENILLDETEHPQLCDFEFSRYDEMDWKMVASNPTCLGTPGYLAPEIILQKSYTKKCDVYSFGIVCYCVYFDLVFPFEGVDRCDPRWGVEAEKQVFGYGYYDGESSICNAAAHAGYGRSMYEEVNIVVSKGRDFYFGKMRNGIPTEWKGPSKRSFFFKDFLPKDDELYPTCPDDILTDNIQSLFKDGEAFTCIATGLVGVTIYGDGYFGSDSNINIAAHYMGVLQSGEEGLVTVVFAPGQEEYYSGLSHYKNFISEPRKAMERSYYIKGKAPPPLCPLNLGWDEPWRGQKLFPGDEITCMAKGTSSNDYKIYGINHFSWDTPIGRTATFQGLLYDGEWGLVTIVIAEGNDYYADGVGKDGTSSFAVEKSMQSRGFFFKNEECPMLMTESWLQKNGDSALGSKVDYFTCTPRISCEGKWDVGVVYGGSQVSNGPFAQDSGVCATIKFLGLEDADYVTFKLGFVAHRYSASGGNDFYDKKKFVPHLFSHTKNGISTYELVDGSWSMFVDEVQTRKILPRFPPEFMVDERANKKRRRRSSSFGKKRKRSNGKRRRSSIGKKRRRSNGKRRRG